MLTRDQQRLLAALADRMTAQALLDQLRQRGTLEGGCSCAQPGCWISYNRTAVWLEDHTGYAVATQEAMASIGGATSGAQARQVRPVKYPVVVKVTWARAAAHGASPPTALRQELADLERSEREEAEVWRQFSDARGGWPRRARFDSEEEHREAEAEWDAAWAQHLRALYESGSTAHRHSYVLCP